MRLEVVRRGDGGGLCLCLGQGEVMSDCWFHVFSSRSFAPVQLLKLFSYLSYVGFHVTHTGDV